ncbi:DUF962 domain-containing protein [Pseudomonas akapageensis]|uniref:Mpo1 family 2-hydroxy fatty acid dioxygenase n=1 Tax=Pseudomonas akapageensis TaxID=2609961 RepID=UPI00140AB833|nr:Mpo1-like protein [Pseudomonas akapageensis]
MKSLVEHLSRYAAYHRDPRNIATHFIGVPMIVVAVTVLLSRPGLSVLGGAWVSPAAFAAMAAAWFYLRLDERYGVLMSIFLGLCLWVGQVLAEQDTLVWLGAGLGLFVVGWAIQFVGHYYEGRKPAFVDDVTGLIVGPLFVVAELGFLMGMRLELKREIEANAGPVGLR